jgi:hypothetical protein
LGVIGSAGLIFAGAAAAQNAISAKAGMVNYVEGAVFLDGKAAKVTLDNFPQMRNGSELRTEEGRAEVLLGPGVLLRLGENSAVRMVSDEIMATRVEFLSGSAVVESAEVAKDQSLTFIYKGASIDLAKKGLYRFDGEPPQVRVYDGEARVVRDGQTQAVKSSHLLRLDGVAVAEKFDEKDSDALLRWARRRSEYLSVANFSMAREANQYGFWGSNNWILNPYLGSFTYLPMSGVYNSFWGYSFWSPATVSWAYLPQRYAGVGGVPGSTSSTSSSNSNVSSSSVGAVSRGASSTSVGVGGHGGGAGGGRGR